MVLLVIVVMMMVVVVVVGRTLFPPVRRLHLLSRVGQIPRGPPMGD